MMNSISLKRAWYWLIILVTILPMTIIVSWIGYREYSLLLTNAIQKEGQLNHEMNVNIKNKADSIIALLQNKSDPMAFTLSRLSNKDLLIKLFEAVFSRENTISTLSLTSTKYQNILSMNRDGSLIESTDINIKSPGNEEGQQKYKHLFLTTPPGIVIPLNGRIYVGSPLFREEISTFEIGIPVGPLNHPIAVLTASVNTEELWGSMGLSPTILRPDVCTYLVDSHGRLLITPSDGNLRIGNLVTHLNIVRSVIANTHRDSAVSYTGINGDYVYGTSSFIDTLNWGVISEIPRKQITDPIYTSILSVLAIIIFVSILTGGTSLLFTNRLFEPLTLINRAFGRISMGDYDTKLADSPIKEINAIVGGFNKMANDINQMYASQSEMLQNLNFANRELEEREQRYRSLTYNIPGAVYRSAYDPFWTMEFISDHIENISGYPCSDFIGNRVRSFASIIYYEDKQMVDKAVQEGLRRKTDFVCEYRIIDSDSQIRWIYEKGQGIFDNKGELSHLSGVIFDVTKNKQAEGDLRKNFQAQDVLNNLLYMSLKETPLVEQLEDSLSLILSVPWIPALAKSGIFLVGEEPDMLVLKVKRGLTAGVLETCTNVPFGRCICGRAASSGKIEHVDRVDERHENLYKGIHPHGHYCVPIMDGVRVLGVLLLYLNEGHKRNEQEVMFLESVTSALAGIIKRKHVENVLKESEEKYRTMFEASKVGMALCKTDGTLVECNRAYFEIIGYTKEEAMQLSYWDITPTTFKEDEDRQLRSLEETGQYGPYEKEYIRKDGIRIPVQLNGVLVKGADGNDYIWSIVQNITERKQAEYEMAKITVEMKERNEELERFHKITVGRELDMIRLKEEINALFKKSGQPKKYEVPEE